MKSLWIHKNKKDILAEIGKVNTLDFIRETENGIYLDGGILGEILMPRKFVTPEVMNDGKAEVFIYSDSEDRLVATTEKPFAMVGEFAFLEVAEVTRFGAFLDWGLPKQLLVPFGEQKAKMTEGNSYLVYLYTDTSTNRIAASAKIEKFLDSAPPEYETGDEVQILIAEETDLGYRTIVDSRYKGMLYKNQLFSSLLPGDRMMAYVNKVREDGKIDLLAERPGYQKIDEMAEGLLQLLKDNNGFLALSDKSSPDMIKQTVGMSKKNFKKVIGQLYKRRIVDFHSDGIRLL